MSPKKSTVRNKTVRSQSREIVANVHAFMKNEADEGTFIIDLKKVQERVSKATGVSKRSVIRIMKEHKGVCEGLNDTFSTPGKKHKVPKRVTEIDDFDKCVIRRTVHNFYVQQKTLPTVKKLLPVLKESIGFKGGQSSLNKILKTLGFKWMKTKNNRKILTEKHDIQFQRTQYLTAVQKYRQDNRPIIYTDETYIHSSHSAPKSWQDESISQGFFSPISKGQRLIIVHAGSINGFVPGASLIFKSNQVTGDYKNDMNFANFKRWVTEKLIPNLPAQSVVILDNASYHNVQLEKAPTSASSKNTMKKWLTEMKIPFHPDLLKTQLYDLIKLHKPRHKTYAIDKLLAEHGHSVLRLPPYHPDLNPIELIWSDLKNWVSSRNVTFKIEDVKNLCTEKFNLITKEDWEIRCKHVLKLEQEYIEKAQILDNIIDEFIVNLGEASDSSDGDSDSDSETDDPMSGIEPIADSDQDISL